VSDIDLSPHAMERFSSHLPEVLTQQVEQGIPVGAQRGADTLLQLPCGLVAVVRRSSESGRRTVVTVLPRDYAIVNMQVVGIQPLATPRGADLSQLRVAGEAENLQKLAEEHAQSCLSKKERNAILRGLGYDVQGAAGGLYREYYLAAMDRKFADMRAAYKRQMKGLQDG